MPSEFLNSVQTSQEEANKPSSSSSSPKSGSSLCSSPPEAIETQNSNDQINTYTFKTESTITDHMNSLTKLMPSIIEAASLTSLRKPIGSNNTQENSYKEDSLPPELKSRLYSIFNQIEREFDALYSENIRLQRLHVKNRKF